MREISKRYYSMVLESILDCGCTDVEFMINESEDFGVEIGEAVEVIKDNGDDLNVNTILFEIYDIAVTRAMEDVSDGLGFKEDVRDKIQIYINYMDSSISVDAEIAHDYEELKQMIAKYEVESEDSE